ncbi:MAG: 30S ribosomal protein S5 [Candidatus Hydrogenedentota bacterium]|nr:MAG: 30S ribosomal protein S5 [Candidatus Hydrogenedentota bacterium]
MMGTTGSKSRRRGARRESPRRNVHIIDNNEVELTERVVKMSRVAKVVKGGRRFSFNALTVVGDNANYVGVGFGKAKEVPEAIRKSIEDGKKNLFKVPRQGNTIPHEVMGKYKSARVLLKPGAPGTGIIAGEAVRAVVELAGIQDVLTKRLGSSNALNIVKATIDALKQLETPEMSKEKRGITLPKLFGDYARKRREEKLKEAGIEVTPKEENSEAESQEVSETMHEEELA